MNFFSEYSPIKLIRTYHGNRSTVESYLADPKNPIYERLSDGQMTQSFMAAFIIFILIWAWAIYSIWKYWNELHPTIAALAIIFLFIAPGPLLSIAIVYLFRKQ